MYNWSVAHTAHIGALLIVPGSHGSWACSLLFDTFFYCKINILSSNTPERTEITESHRNQIYYSEYWLTAWVPYLWILNLLINACISVVLKLRWYSSKISTKRTVPDKKIFSVKRAGTRYKCSPCRCETVNNEMVSALRDGTFWHVGKYIQSSFNHNILIRIIQFISVASVSETIRIPRLPKPKLHKFFPKF